MRVLVLTHQEYSPPDNVPELSYEEVAPFKTEYDVIAALHALGHETYALGGARNLASIRDVILDWKPNVAFNLMEEFHGEGFYVPYVLGYLELMHIPFTGCNPSGLMLADRKELMKKLLRYHRIPIPDFFVCPRGRTVRRPGHLDFPLIVKSTTAHGSAGISQASLVTSDEKLRERVEFVHAHLQTDAMVEEYVEGRELYMGVIGNRRLETLPLWEMVFENLAQGAAPIATARVKWDRSYQEKRGIDTHEASDVPEATVKRIRKLCRRVYRILELSGYARMDFRLTADGRVHLLEPNPNPDLARDEDFSDSAYSSGIQYEKLIERIVNLGMRYFGGRPVARAKE